MVDYYRQSTGSILAASPDHDSLEQYTRRLKETTKSAGGEFWGPKPLPVVEAADIDRFLRHIELPERADSPAEENLVEWLFGLVDSQENLDRLLQCALDDSALFGRECRATGEQSIRKVFSIEAPEDVLAVAELGTIEHPKNFGHDPHTYDPNLDYVTDP